MNSFKKIILILFPLVILSGCEDGFLEEPEPVYIISGTLKESCGGPVVPNAYLEIFQNSGLFTSPSQGWSTYSDSNGRFEFNYKNSSGMSFNLDCGSPGAFANHRIMGGIPAKKNIDLGDQFLLNQSYLYIKVRFNSAYSTNDTLYYALLPSAGPRTFNGPFPSTLMDSVLVTKGAFTYGNYYALQNEPGRLIWGIGYSDYNNSLQSNRPDLPDYHIESFTFRGCGYNDTAVINVL